MNVGSDHRWKECRAARGHDFIVESAAPASSPSRTPAAKSGGGLLTGPLPRGTVAADAGPLKAMPPPGQGIDYEGHWDRYAGDWRELHPDKAHIGDEWEGVEAGAAQSLAEYTALIESRFIAPFVRKDHAVLEIGVGGGRTAELLLAHCDRLVCADISARMLQATRARLGEERVRYVKLDGITLDGIPPASVDVCFCYDTMVHLEPRDIFNYLSRIPALLKGDRFCIFHHTDILGEAGWRVFLRDWRRHLQGRHGTAFSVMTAAIMERFLRHLGYRVLVKDDESVPRDCVWICQGPA